MPRWHVRRVRKGAKVVWVAAFSWCLGPLTARNLSGTCGVHGSALNTRTVCEACAHGMYMLGYHDLAYVEGAVLLSRELGVEDVWVCPFFRLL